MSVDTITTRADNNHLMLEFLRELADYDTKMPLGAILVLLELYHHRNEAPDVSQKEVRTNLGMSGTATTRSIQYWPEDLIHISIDPGDRRGRRLRLTKKGVDFLDQIYTTIG